MNRVYDYLLIVIGRGVERVLACALQKVLHPVASFVGVLFLFEQLYVPGHNTPSRDDRCHAGERRQNHSPCTMLRLREPV